ncbi:hypothetical protein RFI_22619 [Reticulomyxa filosa]|uniref:Uncharacterized protein n=1 Tax=Reticulomyxa filosa TaxID=46433 RepID=X6MMS9_RETFI|nr:hypothetical protein RFI_22619 [Reticulomyxa filosa]|eukprot:ETO14747.1 hypothetical protein RFI_22619 [Reticulomyxa filosa]
MTRSIWAAITTTITIQSITMLCLKIIKKKMNPIRNPKLPKNSRMQNLMASKKLKLKIKIFKKIGSVNTEKVELKHNNIRYFFFLVEFLDVLSFDYTFPFLC